MHLFAVLLPWLAQGVEAPVANTGSNAFETLVAAGTATDPDSLPAGWRAGPDALHSDAGAAAYASGWLADGPASVVQLELALEVADTTAASLVLGDSHVGFCGRDGRPFLEGPLFGGGVRHLEREPPVRGKRFRIEVRRSAERLNISWDGEELFNGVIPQALLGGLGEVALRPHRDRMRVFAWAMSGVTPAPSEIGERSVVWTAGEGGVHTYRIPALIVAPDGSLLAFAEARQGASGDSGDIDLVVKRSSDGGRTWGAAQTVWNDGANTCGNPCPIVDAITGTLFLLATHNLGEDHEAEIIAGTSRGTRTVWLLESGDSGRSWSQPRELTGTTKREDWTWYATGPGAGIQLARGTHAGRLVVPCDHIEADSRRYYSHVIYSDDHGETWSLGGSTPRDQVNECEVAELSDGRLLLNMRNYDRAQRTRQQAWSDDGGLTWTGQRHVPGLVEPICQASLRRLRWPAEGSAGVLLFSNPASADARRRLVLRASFDDGETWPWSALLDRGPAAYSCLSVQPDGALVCLYEAGGYRSIVAQRLETDELPTAAR